MNLVLLDSQDTRPVLRPEDPRRRHILEVLRPEPGKWLDVGCRNGPRGRARVLEDSASAGMQLEVVWGSPPPSLFPLTLMVGMPRPQTARSILRTASTFGARTIVFFGTTQGEGSYRESRLWTTGEWERHLEEGAAQAFSTLIPSVHLFDSLMTALEFLPAGTHRTALDVYEGLCPLHRLPAPEGPAVLAVGGERGWHPAERDLLRSAGFLLAHLGERVLRSDQAVLAGAAILAVMANWLSDSPLRPSLQTPPSPGS